jgi:hypothetical protein
LGGFVAGAPSEGELVDLAGELEWRIVAIFHQATPVRVRADVEGFILGE